MKRTVLITLGRLPKALELARALAGAGCRVLVAEPFARHVCRPSRSVARSFRVTAPNVDCDAYLAELLAIVEAEGVDLVIGVSEEALHAVRLAAMLPPHVAMFGETEATLLELHDKLRFARKAAKQGLSVPPTFEADAVDVAGFCRQNDFVVKPRNSCSGIGVSIQRRGTVPAPGAAAAGAIVQGFVEGRHVSTFTLAHRGRERFTVAYEGTVFSGTVAVCFKRVEGLVAVEDWVRRFVSANGCNGFISFDFIVAPDGRAHAIECNPRITSGIHFADPSDLARAILSPADAAPVRLRPLRKFQQAYSTLTEAYAHFLRPREFVRRMKELFTARDVVWSWTDPLPFLLMTPMSVDILFPAIVEGIPLGEAAMRDIARFDHSGAGDGLCKPAPVTRHAVR